jgi:pimeloyl-ACP methyl ester carboxylesterase
MYATWRKSKSGHSFADLILQDSELQDYDVLLFGYRTGYLRGASIENAAIQLRTALSYLPENQYSSIVLIAHSMGGLISMQYIVDQLQNSVVPPITGLMLYGTPTTGSDLINVAKVVGYGIGLKVPGVRIAINWVLRGQRQIADLATGSEFLSRLHAQWAYRVVNGGHEKAGRQRMWLPVRVVTGEDDWFVKEISGKGVYGAMDWLPISCGHVDLVKPAGASDPLYMAAKTFLQMSRRIDPQILDRVWQASQDIWGFRSHRVSEQLVFFTVIRDMQDAQDTQTTLNGFSISETICEYDFVLEKDYVEFGISVGDNEVWTRKYLPVYVHQIGLNLLKQDEKNFLRASVDAVLSNQNDQEVWSRFFSKASITVDGFPLVEGEFIWPQSRQFANWLLRKYVLPKDLRAKVGTKIRLKIDYASIVPLALPQFTFSAPWIINGIDVRVVVLGDFEYFVSSHRLVPRGKIDRTEDQLEKRREARFSYNGILLPGSAFEVRWRRTQSGRRR